MLDLLNLYEILLSKILREQSKGVQEGSTCECVSVGMFACRGRE